MKVVFMGTPDFAVPVLEALLKEHQVVAVYTRAPKESGRGKKVNKTPVHLIAEQHNIPVFTPKSLKTDDEISRIKSFGADVAIVAAYGLLLPQAVLDAFPKGCINVHASLLPRWRGAAPIQRSIQFGDTKSGISIMKMALALDAGDVLSQKSITISHDMTGGDLHDALAQIGAGLLIDTLRNLDALSPVKQEESLVTYAEKLNKAECLLDFNSDARVLINKIRAFSPYPATYFTYLGERFKIYKASVVPGQGKPGEILSDGNTLIIAVQNSEALKIEKIQREGKQLMNISDLLRGFTFSKGDIVNS